MRFPEFSGSLMHGFLLVLAVAASTGTAQDRGRAGPGTANPLHRTAAGLELPLDSGRWIAVDRLIDPDSEDDPWRRLKAVLGAGWKVTRDGAFGSPRWIMGPGFSPGTGPMSQEEAVRFSRDLARRLAGPLGIDDPSGLEVMRVAATPNPHGHVILGVDFKQTLQGYDVRTLDAHRRVLFRFDLTLGRLSNLGSEWIPGLRVKTGGVLDRKRAIQLVREVLPKYAPGTGRVFRIETYVLVGLAEDSSARGRLVHEVRVQTDNPPHLWSVVLDARTGDILRVADEIRRADVIGQVSLGGLDGPAGTPPAVPFSVKPARDLHVSIPGGGKAVTDASGKFRIPDQGTAPVTVTGGLVGDWCTVNAGLGTPTIFARPATPGISVNIVLNATHVHQYPTAEATAYDWVTRCHYYVEKRIPGFKGLPKLTTDVNQFFLCNGAWTGSAIQFTMGGCSGTICCNNTAFSDLIAHEWGHGFHAWFHGKASPATFSEGIADHLALYITGQRVFGRGIDAQARFTRDYRLGGAANQTRWPPVGQTSHKAGEIWAGTMMDMRDNLMTKHGAARGVDIAEAISIAAYTRNPPDMQDGIREVFVQDDNDATLLNGTPNFKEIAAAADRHLLPRPPDPQFVQFKHVPLTATRDTVNDYRISAEILSLVGTIQKASLTYWIGSGPPTTVPMTRVSGTTHAATIPAQSAVTLIQYVLSAQDSMNNAATLPSNNVPFKFHVARETVALADDFETDRGWKPAQDDTATTGRFERVDPFHAFHTGRYLDCQPEDDHTPGAGTHCYVTENGPRGKFPGLYDVTGGKTTMISPPFDLSRAPPGTATLNFAYWFTDWTTPNDELKSGVSVDDGKTWKNIWKTGTSASAWKEVKDLPIPGPYSGTTRIRFWAEDPEFMTICDTLIDDVVVRYLDDNVAALRAQTRTPAVGSTLHITIQATRELNGFYVLALSGSLGPVRIPGIGVMDLGLPVYPTVHGTLGGSGKAAYPVPIPNDPVLKGARVHLQALITGQASIFSNVWTLDLQ